MTLETALAAIDVAERSAGQPGEAVHVIFFGGEPLLRRSLIEQVVATCSQRVDAPRPHFQLVTNGTLCDMAFVAFAARHGISISLSLDGTREAHDLHRKTPQGEGTWERVIAAIPLLLASNPYLHAQMVLSPSTAHLVDASVSAVYAQGIRHVSTALDYGANWDRGALERLGGAYRRLAKAYETWTRRGDRFYLSCFDARIRTRVRGPCEPSERCTPGLSQLSVAPSGTLYPCVQFVGDDARREHVIGHVNTGIDPTAVAHFRERSERDKPACDGCALEGRCMNWCACANWASTGSVELVSPILCEHERMLMPIVDDLGARLFRVRSSMFLDKHYNAAFPIMSVIRDVLEGDRRR